MVQRRMSRGGAGMASRASSTNPFDSDDESPPRYKDSAPASSYSNPFDDEERPASSSKLNSSGRPSKVSNPFDDEPDKDEKNPFDDEGMWNRRHENSKKPAARRSVPSTVENVHAESEFAPPARRSVPSKTDTDRGAFDFGKPAADSHHLDDEAPKQRRREKVKEVFSAMSDDVASKASKGMDYVRPRSKNLMGTSQNRQQLLDEDDTTRSNNASRNEQKKFTHARIDRAFKAGESLEGESVQELEDYAVHKAEETTAAAYNALKVAEDIREGATRTAIMLHDQGQQITRTHDTAVDIDHELSRGEKLLGSLGGLFSKTWKPKKGRNITGPMLTRGDSFKRKAYGMEQRAALGLTSPRARNRSSTSTSGDSSGMQFQARVKNEFSKQDDALADLSNVLDQLKEMSVDMGSEIGRQNNALGHLEDDVSELGERVGGANERGRKLLGR